MEGRVDDAGRDALGDLRADGGFAGAAADLDPRAVAHTALLGVVRMDFEHVLVMPYDVGGPAGLGSTLYWERMRPVVRISGNRGPTFSSVGMYSVITKRPLPRMKLPTASPACPRAPCRCMATARGRGDQAFRS